MYLGIAKDTSQADATSNNEKIKPIALAMSAMSYSCLVDLKVCLSLVLPANTAPSLSGKIEAVFWVILFCGPHLLFGRLYYGPLLLTYSGC